jgi:hypothetical protein
MVYVRGRGGKWMVWMDMDLDVNGWIKKYPWFLFNPLNLFETIQSNPIH